MKLYNNGLLIGRFQPLHNGHVYMIRKALKICKTVTVFVGSSQEKGTFKNPFSYDYRKELITKTFKKYVISKRLNILPLEDKGYGNTPKWGDYVFDYFYSCLNSYPDLYVTGFEIDRSNWLLNKNIDQLCLSRNIINISATECRDVIKNDNFKKFCQIMPKQLYKEYNRFKEIMNEISNCN